MGLRGSALRFCVSDNAANMLAAIPKHTKKIDVGLGCIDHLLNLIVKATNKIPEVEDALKECKDLSGRVHHTPLDQQRIKRECFHLHNDSTVEVDCKYRKIITAVDTRWNSSLFMAKSIHLLRPALESIGEGRFDDLEKTDPKLKNLIPSPTSFQVLEQVIPIMEKVLMLSEVLSGDKKPTIQHVRYFQVFIS